MNFENMTLGQIYDFFDECFGKPEDPQENNECEHNWIITETGHTCNLCGVVDIHRMLHEHIHIKRKNYHLYHRIIYFREKMKLLTGHKQSQSPRYNEIVNSLKDCEFEDIFQLKNT
mgnify:FL=1